MIDKKIISERNKKYNKNNKDKIYKRRKQFLLEHKEEVKTKRRKDDLKYYLSHKEQKKIQRKNYQQNNKEQIRKQDREYRKQRRNIDINFKLKCYLRTRLSIALKKNIKSESTMRLLGCHIDLLKLHLQSKFKPGMSFSNYGKWHIDHIKPCVSFDLSKKSEQLKCFHWTNLQPLWAEENLRKYDKL